MERSKTISEINKNAKIAHELLAAPAAVPSGSISEIYARNDEEIAVDTIEIKVNEPSVNVMYMSELLIGNQAAAIDFYNDTIDRVMMSPDINPDVIVVSGLMQGDFKFFKKPQRASLVPGLDGMGSQFREARALLDRTSETGAKKIIYNMSDDDRRIAEDATVEVFRKITQYAKDHDKSLKQAAKSTKDGNKADKSSVKPEDFMNWASIDKMRQNPHWNEHRQFQIDTVFPYELKAGRRLYTDEEMKEQTDGQIDIEEYFLLYDISSRMAANRKLTKAQRSWLKTVKATQNNDIIVTDDVNLNIKTRGSEYTDWVRHSLGFSSSAMYQNHMTTPASALGQLAAGGYATPNMLVTQNNKEAVGVSTQNHWSISTGSMIDPYKQLQLKGSHADITGDVARRLMATRKRLTRPSAEMHERTDDGRHIVTFWNDKLYEKSFSLVDRMSIAEICDLQTGSITARPDLLAMYLSFIRERVIGERATALFFGGDMIHGRNYSHFPSESQSTGLMAIESQKEFNEMVFKDAFAHATEDELSAILKVLVQPGNHEWNSGTLKWHGDRFVDYLVHVFREIFIRAGYSEEELRRIIQTQAAFTTPKGEYATGDVGIEYYGDYGVLIQHYLMERGGKGSGGDLPVYQAHHFMSGGGELMQSVDVFMAGHWHHPQYGMFSDKLGIVGGSMAGLSDYELKRAYRPTPSGTILHIGGGQPPQIEFVSEQALHKHTIKTGRFTQGQLAEEGFRDDKNFDPLRHGMFTPDSEPHSALQKKLRMYGRAASQRISSIAEFRA